MLNSVEYRFCCNCILLQLVVWGVIIDGDGGVLSYVNFVAGVGLLLVLLTLLVMLLLVLLLFVLLVLVMLVFVVLLVLILLLLVLLLM